ncbi:hypothetical protein [Streptomyces sp. NPDC016845]|uniref:hypothetical protein n=1 Tax=Streptomyces sp. NPDC016845 TaxID=3364972 RepID=UPI0037B102AB
MAHAAPAPARSTQAGRPATPSASMTALALPVLAGILYGFWAANIERYGHEVTGGNIALGLISGVLVAALCFGIHLWSARQGVRHILLRALVWGVFAGAAIGFLHSLANGAVVWSMLLGLAVGVGVLLGTLYRFYSSSEYTDAHKAAPTRGRTLVTK